MLDNRIGYQLKRVDHALRLAMDDALRSLALTTPQYAVLSVLAAQPGSSGAALARDCFVTPQTMNAIVALMTEAALIVRRPHAENRRIVQLFLTAHGTQTLTAADERVLVIEERMLAQLSDAERQRFANMLARCLQSLPRDSA